MEAVHVKVHGPVPSLTSAVEATSLKVEPLLSAQVTLALETLEVLLVPEPVHSTDVRLMEKERNNLSSFTKLSHR